MFLNLATPFLYNNWHVEGLFMGMSLIIQTVLLTKVLRYLLLKLCIRCWSYKWIQTPKDYDIKQSIAEKLRTYASTSIHLPYLPHLLKKQYPGKSMSVSKLTQYTIILYYYIILYIMLTKLGGQDNTVKLLWYNYDD